MLTKIKKSIFLVWSAAWIILLMLLTILSPFVASVLFVDWVFILFMAWISYDIFYPQIDWDDLSDIVTAECTIGLFGGIFGTVINELLLNNGVTRWEAAREPLLIFILLSLGIGTLFYIIGAWKSLSWVWRVILTGLVVLTAISMLTM